MAGSATSRAGRVRLTAEALRTTARMWTAERGLAGFTIDELCATVGVSRRTFFNYYTSKENAVLGVPLQRHDALELEDQFVAADGDLFDDLLVLATRQWEQLSFTPADVSELRQALDREPRLVTRALELATRSESDYTRLVARRYRWPDGDVRAVTAVQIAVGLLRSAAAEFFADGATDLPTLVRQRLVIARDLFAVQRLEATLTPEADRRRGQRPVSTSTAGSDTIPQSAQGSASRRFTDSAKS